MVNPRDGPPGRVSPLEPPTAGLEKRAFQRVFARARHGAGAPRGHDRQQTRQPGADELLGAELPEIPLWRLRKRREGDLNPRRTIKPETVFETAAFDRSAISPRGSVHAWGTIADPGEVSERSKERAWKARNRVFPGSRVQIPLSPSVSGRGRAPFWPSRGSGLVLACRTLGS